MNFALPINSHDYFLRFDSISNMTHLLILKKNYKARNLPKFLRSKVREVEFFILRSHRMERSLCEVTSLVTFCSRLRKEEVQAYWFLKGKNRTNLYSKPIIDMNILDTLMKYIICISIYNKIPLRLLFM